MKSVRRSIFLALGATAATGSARPAEDRAVVAYHCSDLVVIGRLENLDYEHVEIEDDILGHGWMTARVHVRRVLFGDAEERVVPVSYFGHGYLRDDRDFVLVINRAEPDGNLIRSAHLIDRGRRPRLADSCE